MRPLGDYLPKSNPLHSDLFSPASVGEEKQPVVTMLIHSPLFHLLFSQPPRSGKSFIPQEKPLIPEDLHPRGATT